MSRVSSRVCFVLLVLPACGELEPDALDARQALDVDEPEGGEPAPSEQALMELEADNAPALPVEGEDDARELLMGDFDGDGRTDIFRADWNGNGRQYNLALLSRGNTWERWAGPEAILLGGAARQLYVGDFDGDGRDDVFRADQGGNGYQYNTWFSPTGSGGWTWKAGPQVALAGEDRQPYIGDFNGDGRDDILLAYNDSTSENRIYISNGDGSWTAWAGGLNYWLGGADRQVLIGDFDGDGDDDILRADGGGDGTQYNRLALSNGSGGWSATFNSPARQLRGDNRALVVGDFDGDGDDDILRADWNGDGSQWNAVIPSHGNGSWGYWGGLLPVSLAPGDRALHIADFDADGRDDLLLADWGGSGTDQNRVFRSLASGGWDTNWAAPNWWLGGSNRQVFLGDFDADGRADVLRVDWNADGKRYNRVDRSDGDGTWSRGPDPLIWLGGDAGVGLPEIPALARSVTGYEDGEFVKPHVPPLRTSNDGRVGVYMKPAGGRPFALLTPEALDDHFVNQAPGVPVLSAGSPHTVSNAWFDGAAQGNGHHLTLCDGSSPFAGMPDHDNLENPRACGANDCYDLTTVTTVDETIDGVVHKRLWSRPIIVEVANPKSASAEIVDIRTKGAAVSGPAWAVNEVFEPMFSADGRLFVFRVGGSNFSWTDASDSPRIGNYDMAYAVIPEGSSPCDITAIDGPYPVSHAPFHPGLGERYGFARSPFRDPEGNPIPDGVDIKGTYPWIDRQGRNLFFPAVNATLHYSEGGAMRTRYPARCVPGVACDLTPDVIGDVEAGGETRGIVAMGLWTKGKMVLLDGEFANIDYGLNQEALAHREIQLYDPFSAPAGDPSGWVRVGTGRDNVATEMPTHAVVNTTFIDSLEHLFNHEPNMFPATPRDVVWTLNSGRASADVAFDNYLHRDAIIVAEGNASLTHDSPSYARNGAFMHHHDGFHETGAFAGTGFGDEVRLQNAASGGHPAIPDYGVGYGNVRIEPAAIGGIVGKGMWLDGYSGFGFQLDAPVSGEAFVGVFVDLRPAVSYSRPLLRFADGSELRLSRTQVRYRHAGVNYSRSLPAAITAEPRTWTHVGVQFNADASAVEVYIDGMLLTTFSTPAHTPLQAGSLSLGSVDGSAGVRGWTDELLVFADRPDLETVCNLAHGTMIGSAGPIAGTWGQVSGAYPSSTHAAISAALTSGGEPSFERYACYHDYDLDHGILAETLPPGTESVRQGLLFPEGPLVWNTPRPDSSTNAFCLDCHDDSEAPVLSVEVLELELVDMQHDPRRQPMQAPRVFGGWLPADIFGADAPAADQAPVGGSLVDEWLAAP